MRQHYRYHLRVVGVAWTTTPQQRLHEDLERKTMEQQEVVANDRCLAIIVVFVDVHA